MFLSGIRISFVVCMACVVMHAQATEVSLINRPIPPSQTENYFFDRNGDGTLDYVVLTMLGTVDSRFLQHELDSLVFSWPDPLGKVSRHCIRGNQFYLHPHQSNQIIWKNDNPKQFMAFTTRILPEYGEAFLYAQKENGQQTVVPVNISDAMPPVIKEAVLSIGANNNDDVLTVHFSEPVQIRNHTTSLLFDFFSNHEYKPLQYSSYRWKDSSTLVLTFSSDIDFQQRPCSLDSIRMHEEVFQDLKNNAVPQNDFLGESFANYPYRMILGDYRFELITSPELSYSPRDSRLIKAPPFELVYRPYQSQVDKTVEMGLRVNFGSSSLGHALQKSIRDRYFKSDENQLIETIPVDTSMLKIQLGLSLYTPQSGYVGSKSQTLSCTHPLFHPLGQQNPNSQPGNCLDNPAQLFLRWNFKSDQDRWVGTGAYLVVLHLKVWYDGHYPILLVDQKKTETWGVIRQGS